MTRGFITVATGKKHYYKLAALLLLSYRRASANPMQFAIIAEEENEFTDNFDLVILTSEAEHSFMDKLLVMKLSPFDETIFIDADCLAYGDLNKYWEVFEKSTDFSAFGENLDLYDNRAWYNVEGIGQWGKMIDYKTRVHLGVFFVRKTDKIEKLWDDVCLLYAHYDELRFNSFANSIDEAIMGVAMPLNRMEAVCETANLLGVLPCLKTIRANIIQFKLSFETKWGSNTENGILLHFGTASTYRNFYRFEAESLLFYDDYNTYRYKILYILRARKLSLYIEDCFDCIAFVLGRMMRFMKRE